MNLECFLKSAGKNGYLTIDSEAPKLGYVIDPDDRERVMLATEYGRVILNRRQMAALIREAADILEVFG